MTRHFERAIEALKIKLLELAALVDQAVFKAVKSVEERDAALAAKVVADDVEIDRREVEIEEQCLQILALNQPVAHDLRFVISALKMNNELERIADLGSSIAWRGKELALHAPVKIALDLGGMAAKVKSMLQRSHESLVTLDAAEARAVLQADDEVDELNRVMLVAIENELRTGKSDVPALMYLAGVVRSLERIADHTTNIAEDVIYLVEGVIVRHVSKA